MIDNLKFVFWFLYELIFSNKIKMIYIFIIVISYIYAGTFKDDISTYNVINTTKHNGDYIYTVENISDNKVEYKNFWDKTPINIIDSKLSITSYNGFNVLMWVISVAFLIVLLIATFLEDDTGWEFSTVYKEAISKVIHSEEESGQYYYTIFGRLIYKSDTVLTPSSYYGNLASYFGIRGISSITSLPKFKTRAKKRETLLNSIGIK